MKKKLIQHTTAFFEKTFFMIISFSLTSMFEKKMVTNKIVVIRRRIKKEKTRKVGTSNFVLDSSINLLNI